MNSSGFVYALPPIDHWESLGWQVPPPEPSAAASVYAAMTRIPQHPYWEDEVIQGPYVLPLPGLEYGDGAGTDEGQWCVGVKIRNNGTSFVWSPVELHYLNEYL